MSIKADRLLAVRTEKTVYKDGETVLKVFEPGRAKTDVMREALNQSCAEELGLRVPRLLEVAQADGRWFIRSEFIEGKTLTRIMEEEPDRRQELIERFTALHLDILSRTSVLLPRLSEELDRYIRICELSGTVRHELRTRLAAFPLSDNVCHGEFSPSNVIIMPDDTPCIVDWAHASRGCPDADAARTCLLLRLKGEEKLAESYLALYCEGRGVSPDIVKSRIPVVAAAQSVISRQPGRGMLLAAAEIVTV